MTTNDTSDCKLDYKWLRVNTSKNVGELSFLTFLLKVIKGNYEPEHNQNTSGYEPNYNSANKLFKVAKQDIIIEKPLRWFFKQITREDSISEKIFVVGISNPNLHPLGDVLQNSCSKPLLKKQLNHAYEKLHRGIFYNDCTAEQTFFRIAPFCRTSLCRIVTVQFLNHFLSVQYHSISQPINCWLNFTDISTYLKRTTFDVY